MSAPTYPDPQATATIVAKYFSNHIDSAQQQGEQAVALQPEILTISEIIDSAFWASMRREEGYFPKISLAYLSPDQAGQALRFAQPLPLNPKMLTRLAPAVERAGIHLGVWSDGNELSVWGTTRTIPRLCFVLEVIEPGLLVIKYRRGSNSSKFVNVAVIRGNEIKIVDEDADNLPDCPGLLTSLLGISLPLNTSFNVLVQLALSMRQHGRGGTLLVVPQKNDRWRESILKPILYSVSPPFSQLADLMRTETTDQNNQSWQESLRRTIDAIAGLTAVDGATLLNDQYQLLAFGAKIGRHEGGLQVEQVILTEPIVGAAATIVNPIQIGGTRHLSAAQFAQDQPDSLALVASQDGRFTIFSWSPCEGMVHAHRIDSLLL